MFKRILTLTLLVVMILSVASTGMVCLAEEYETREFLFNGDMEWGNASYSSWGTFEVSTDIVHSGTKAAVLRTTADNPATPSTLESRIIMYQNIYDLVGGQPYTVTFSLLKDADFQNATVAEGSTVFSPGYTLVAQAGMILDYYDANGRNVGRSDFSNKMPTVAGEWQKYQHTATAPAGAVRALVHMRSQGIGNMYFDDLSIVGACTADSKEYYDSYRTKLQKGYDMSQYFYNEQQKQYTDVVVTGENHIVHPGFESSSTFTRYWKLPTSYAFTATQVTEDSKSGSYSLKLAVPAGYSGVMPHAYQWLYPLNADTFLADTSYCISTWVKTVNAPLSGGAILDIKLYNAEGNEVGVQSSPIYNTNGEWQQITYVFTMPQGITKLNFYPRCTNSGGMSVYYDDMDFGLASSSNPLILKTKHTFYYPDEGDITATATFNTDVEVIEQGGKIRYSLSDEEGNVIISSDVDAASYTEWTFSPSSVMAKEKKYIVKAIYVHANGTVHDEWFKTKNIYIYDRPANMDKNGNVLDGEIVNGKFVPNGKIVAPFFTYRNGSNGRFDEFAAAGVTVLRPSETVSIELLDELHANGMKALVQLYSGIVGHPSMEKSVIEKVNLVKNHPAVLAYMLMDEPSEHVSPTKYITYDEVLYYLEEGYKLVRSLDPIHPTYLIECWGNFADTFERSSQMCDIFAVDPYPHTINTALGGTITNQTQIAINGVSAERPVWTLTLAAQWGTNYAAPENFGSTMLRYQFYEALWAGATGAGHYVQNLNPTPEGKSYEDVYIETFKQSKESGELDELLDHFSLENSEIFAEGTGNGYRYRSWYKDNGDLYLAIQTKLNDKGKVPDSTPVDISLVSSNGKLTIDGFDATLVNGTSERTVSSVSNRFVCTLAQGEVSLYKIEPVGNISFDRMNATQGDIFPVEYGENIIANGDCESGNPSSFAGCSNTNYSRSSDKAASGTYSMKLTPKNLSGTTQFRAYNLPIDVNSYYEFEFSIYSEDFESGKVPQLWLTYRSPNSSTYQRPRVYFQQSHTHNGKWQNYKYILSSPAVEGFPAETVDFLIDIPAGNEACYIDDVSIRKVKIFNSENLIVNTSFETLASSTDYINTDNTAFGSWKTSAPENIYISADAHTNNFAVGVKNTSFYTNANVDGGKTYLFTAWFNAKDLTSASYPSLKVQAGGFEHVVDFTNAFDKKTSGWYKLSAEVAVPDSVVSNTKATLSLVMNGSDIGYFDDATFRLKGKTGYTLRNLKTSSNASSITVEYDINSHFTEEGGTVIYAFYDANGRLVTMEKELLTSPTAHVTRTFDKIDFASMKIFVWDSLGGMLPYSNIIN